MTTFDEMLRTLDAGVWRSMDSTGAGAPELFPQILIDMPEPNIELLGFEGPWWQ